MIPVVQRRGPPQPEAIDISVVYEDEWLMAIDKPPGMVVHPTYRNWTGTLLNAVLWRVRHTGDATPRIVTRLDKDTSGVVLVALTSELHARVQRDAAAGRVRKEYLAIVRGIPAPACGTIALPLARSADDRRRVVVSAAGQPSETRYEVVASSPGGPDGPPRRQPHSLVRCELVTGRTHQIRVHLAERGWPILGDRTYGGCPDSPLARQALHAWRLTLPHPVSRRLLEIEAPIPSDLGPLVPDLQKLTL
ncbi:MAG: RluA family pseudouridine synthase [Acidobacteria bacterium]|nr:RluA family pseudouridine synthase [Acidobacteriota bacterium]